MSVLLLTYKALGGGGGGGGGGKGGEGEGMWGERGCGGRGNH